MICGKQQFAHSHSIELLLLLCFAQVVGSAVRWPPVVSGIRGYLLWISSGWICYGLKFCISFFLFFFHIPFISTYLFYYNCFSSFSTYRYSIRQRRQIVLCYFSLFIFFFSNIVICHWHDCCRVLATNSKSKKTASISAVASAGCCVIVAS